MWNYGSQTPSESLGSADPRQDTGECPPASPRGGARCRGMGEELERDTPEGEHADAENRPHTRESVPTSYEQWTKAGSTHLVQEGARHADPETTVSTGRYRAGDVVVTVEGVCYVVLKVESPGRYKAVDTLEMTQEPSVLQKHKTTPTLELAGTESKGRAHFRYLASLSTLKRTAARSPRLTGTACWCS